MPCAAAGGGFLTLTAYRTAVRTAQDAGEMAKNTRKHVIMGQNRKPPEKTRLAEISSLLKNVVSAVARYEAFSRSVYIYSRDLQDELERLHSAGRKRVSVTVSVGGNVITFVGGVERKSGHEYVIRPLGEAREQFIQLYLQRPRRPGRKRNPLTVFVLDLRPI